MALDVASLTLDDSQASLASMPEELWRKVTSYLTYYDVTAQYLRFLDDCWSDEAFVQAIRKLGLDAAHNFAKAMLSLHVTTRSLQSHADDPRPPGPTADNPSGGFEAFARSLM